MLTALILAVSAYLRLRKWHSNTHGAPGNSSQANVGFWMLGFDLLLFFGMILSIMWHGYVVNSRMDKHQL